MPGKEGPDDKQIEQRIARLKRILHELAPHWIVDIVAGRGESDEFQLVEGIGYTTWHRPFSDKKPASPTFQFNVMSDRSLPSLYDDLAASTIARNLHANYEVITDDLELLKKSGLVVELSNGKWTANPEKTHYTI
jgi:hypothetical protein